MSDALTKRRGAESSAPRGNRAHYKSKRDHEKTPTAVSDCQLPAKAQLAPANPVPSAAETPAGRIAASPPAGGQGLDLLKRHSFASSLAAQLGQSVSGYPVDRCLHTAVCTSRPFPLALFLARPSLLLAPFLSFVPSATSRLSLLSLFLPPWGQTPVKLRPRHLSFHQQA